MTSAFLHYGLTHLLFNMWALYVVGPPLERWLGWLRFSALYALSAMGGFTSYSRVRAWAGIATECAPG